MIKYLFILMMLCTAVYSENLYCTTNGAGASNGSDWNNAFAGFGDVVWGSGANQLSTGDTLWVAGGSYSTQLELKGSGTSNNLITIKRARTTNSECTSATGWVTNYDSQVVINTTDGIMISSSLTNGPGRYILVDGQITDGIRVNFTDVSQGRGILIEGYGAFHSTFRNIGSYGISTNLLGLHPTGYVNDVRSLVIRTYDGDVTEPFPAYLTFDRCTFAGACAAAFYIHCRYVTMQYCDIHTIETINSEVHANLIYIMRSDNCTIKYNTFHDNAAGVGIFFTDFGSSGIQSSNFFIYGNIFRDDTSGSSRFIDVRDTAAGTGPLFIYNNTFVHGYAGILINTALNVNAESYLVNNLFVDISPGSAINLSGGLDDYITITNNYITNSYSMFVSTGSTNILAAPFSWQWSRNLHLTSQLSYLIGTNLGSSYNIDMDGATRGEDGNWDIGAFEFNTNGGGAGGGGSSQNIFRVGTIVRIGPPSAPSYTNPPNNDITNGLVEWWKVDSLTNTVDGSDVDNWTNSAGPGLATISLNNPTYRTNQQNGLSSVRFIAAGDYLNFTPIEVTNFTVFFVGQISNAASEAGPFDHGVADKRGFRMPGDIGAGYSPHLTVLSTNAEVLNKKAPAITLPTAWMILNWTWDGTTAVCAVNGVDQTLVNGDSGYGARLSRLGQGYNSANCDIGEIRVYDRALTSNECVTVLEFLRDKWGTP